MATEDDATPGIVIPGPELRVKIEKSAASLAKRDRRKAEETMAKVLASPKREEFLFFEMTHVFYPFFLQKLNEFRANPELIPSDDKKTTQASSGNTAGASASNNPPTNTTTTVLDGGVVRREGGTAARHDPKREEALRLAELEAQRYLDDPFPTRYALDLRHGTIDMPALALSYMTHTAQYVAKYGDCFMQDLMGRHRNNAAFRFLNSEDVRHDVFLCLVESYRRILQHDPDDVEDRLERIQSTRYVLDTLCAEKVKYARAAVARRKAALLTDEALRDRLEWNCFTVVQHFTLADLGLDGPMSESAAARRRQRETPLPPLNSAHPNDTGGETGRTGAEDPTAAPQRLGSTSMRGPYAEVDKAPKPPIGVSVPSFKPSFISTHLVTSTDPTAGSARQRSRGGEDASSGTYGHHNRGNNGGNRHKHWRDNGAYGRNTRHRYNGGN